MNRWVLMPMVAAMLMGGCAQSEPMTAERVLELLKTSGIQYSNPTQPARDPASPLPNSYKERVAVTLPSVAPKGGQFFICEKQEYCDAIYRYFDALKGFAGPYLYRSKSGLVVAQLNRGLEPQAAEQVKAVIESIP